MSSTDEEPQVQEVRYSLKTLREQMAARQNNNNNNKFPSNGHKVNTAISKPHGTNGFVNGIFSKCQGKEDEDNCVSLREAIKHLYTRLQETEGRHHKEKERLQEENCEIQQRCLEEHSNLVKMADMKAEEQSRNMEEMQKRMSSLELENVKLQEKLAACELEKQQGMKKADFEDRCVQLEEELATVKNKNHSLNDMIKCIQKRIKINIEQVQISRTTIEQRNRNIDDLKERVSFLEAENREMHDRMEFYCEIQVPKPYISDTGSKVVYSKPLIPTSPGNKSLPFIKVIETKS
ncbi:hypothetical protein E1301_Tti018895 [Triplophysa tibetana]|uniref:Tuftelin n=1 Tax=Triplophysa tibetana TaxID=1572043 RepID=A0A5A9NLE9_9TELE|nr:hypothetical protein E1301_Tti018895 [Triplophysa tibetana]